MKKTVLLILLFILLSGCENSMKNARANDLRAKTDRANDLHNARMAEWGAMTSTRLAAKKKLTSVSVLGGVLLIAAFTVSGSYYMFSVSIVKARQVGIMRVPLDRHTRQYPLLVSGSKAYNPNTLANSDLGQTQWPYPDALEGSYRVQMIGAGEPKYKTYQEYENQKLLR